MGSGTERACYSAARYWPQILVLSGRTAQAQAESGPPSGAALKRKESSLNAEAGPLKRMKADNARPRKQDEERAAEGAEARCYPLLAGVRGVALRLGSKAGTFEEKTQTLVRPSPLEK